jgi:hypothetical protein
VGLRGGNLYRCSLFFGAIGRMTVQDSRFKCFPGDKREPGEAMAMPVSKEDQNFPHVTNFLDVARSRRHEDLNAEVKETATSAHLVHIANISYRTDTKLTLESGATRIASDDQANHHLARHPYRAPYVVS